MAPATLAALHRTVKGLQVDVEDLKRRVPPGQQVNETKPMSEAAPVSRVEFEALAARLQRIEAWANLGPLPGLPTEGEP